MELILNGTGRFSGAVAKSARVSTNDPKRRHITLELRAIFRSGPASPAVLPPATPEPNVPSSW